MLKSLKIQNFRGFRNLEINDLGAVNIIGGRNNAGKTSLLEAIALLSNGGNAAKALKPQILRLPSHIVEEFRRYNLPHSSMSGIGAYSIIRAMDPFLEQLFHGQNLENAINIESDFARCEEKQESASLKISMDENPETNAFLELDESWSGSLLDSHAIKFELTCSESDAPYVSFLWLEENSVHTQSRASAKPLFPSTLLKSKGSGDGPEYAQQLADLRSRKEDPVDLDALKIIEPRLESVSDISLASDPVIVGDIGFDKLIPLAAMGEGMNQIARIILKMISAQGGVALIDEVENGLHYSVQTDVWKAIDETARQSNIQVFATTHSRECVLSAHEALKPERLRYHRLEQIDGELRCRTYSPDILKSAFKFNFEVR